MIITKKIKVQNKRNNRKNDVLIKYKFLKNLLWIYFQQKQF